MKMVFYLLLLVGLAACTTYNVSSQSPNQYTPVSEQVIIEDPDVVYIYTLEYRDTKKQYRQQSGTLTLFR